MSQEVLFISCGQVVYPNSKINWPDLNRPGSGDTTLRYLHQVDYDTLTIQLDGADGPCYTNAQLPQGTGFFKRTTK